MLVACLSVRAVGGGFWSSASRVVSSLGSQTSVYPHTAVSPSASSNEHHCSFCLSVYLVSFLPSITHTWASCLDGSFSTLALLFVWVWRGSIFYCFPSLFSLLIIFLFSLSSMISFSCSFSTTSAHSLSSWEARFSGCFIIQENSVAVFCDQDKWGSFSSMQTLVLSVCVMRSGFMGGGGYARSVNWRCLCVREFDSTWESNTEDRRSVCSPTSNELRLSHGGHEE